MIHCSGNYFCSKSNWDGGYFDVKNLVSIPVYNDEYGNEDYKNMILKRRIPDEEYDWRVGNRIIYCLKPEVIKWLEENIENKKRTSEYGEKAWCVGNDEYNTGSREGFSVFFYRREDALKFIETWSIYKKPTETYNQNTYISEKLDLKTNKLIAKER